MARPPDQHRRSPPPEPPGPTEPRGGARSPWLAGLDDDQLAAVVDPAARLAVVAGAGSGKTRVLTRRVAHRVAAGDADPRRVLVLTFTRRAAGELRHRLAGLGLREHVAAGTFHAVALAELRRRRADRGRPAPVLLVRRSRLVAPLVAALGPGAPAVGTVVREIEWAKAGGTGPDGYVAAVRATRRPVAADAAVVADLFASYERERRRRGVVDFDDLVDEVADALESDPTWRAARRWWWRHLHVDEYQDVTAQQLRVVRGLLGDDGDLFVVGDDQQSIFGFAGARPGMLARFAADVPGGVLRTLGTNHRSTAPIVAAGAAVLGTDPPRAPIGAGPVPVLRGAADPDAEARAVARAVADGLRRGVRAADVAVLARTHARLRVVAAALTRAGIPHRPLGDDAPLTRPDVRAVLDDLRVRAATAPGLPLGSLLADLRLDVELDDASRIAVPPGATPPPAEGAALVLALADEYLALETARPDLDGFEAHLATVRPHDTGPARAAAVTLATFHRAKGLEWDHVHVVGVERGLVPIPGGDPDEEARLVHVAITRARQTLTLGWTEAGEGGRPAGPSPLLARLAGTTSPTPAGPPVAPPGALDTARAALAAGRTRATRVERRPARRPGAAPPGDGASACA